MQFNFKSKIFTVQFTVSNTTPSSYTKVPTSKIQTNDRNLCYGYWCHLWVFIGVAFYSKKKRPRSLTHLKVFQPFAYYFNYFSKLYAFWVWFCVKFWLFCSFCDDESSVFTILYLLVYGSRIFYLSHCQNTNKANRS